jgi:hypothetical protein
MGQFDVSGLLDWRAHGFSHIIPDSLLEPLGDLGRPFLVHQLQVEEITKWQALQHFLFGQGTYSNYAVQLM